MFNEEADMLTPNYHAVGPDENVPAIDAVLNHRLREGIGESIVLANMHSNLHLRQKRTVPIWEGMTSSTT